jgi:hypothetical protein
MSSSPWKEGTPLDGDVLILDGATNESEWHHGREALQVGGHVGL